MAFQVSQSPRKGKEKEGMGKEGKDTIATCCYEQGGAEFHPGMALFYEKG